MAIYVYCYDCSAEFVRKLEEQVCCTPFIYIDSLREPKRDFIEITPCVVITNYQGEISRFEKKFDVSDVVMGVFDMVKRRWTR